jgi:prepilin-type processing-associated H-X9-DG protein
MQCLLLPFLEASNTLALFNMNYNTNSDAAIHTSIPALANANARARVQEAKFFLCPSDPSTAKTFGNAGRLNYMGSLGCSPNYNGGTDVDGIFAIALPAAASGVEMKGRRLGELTDGTSNTAMFSEMKRGTYPSGSASFDHTTSMTGAGVSNQTDGRTVAECLTVQSAKIPYVGQQYYRNLPHNFLYTHTLPPNWNRKMSDPAQQKYICGNAAFNAVHHGASSYHPGGANVGMADGSVRTVADSVDFAVWQAAGTMNRGESTQLP